VRLGEVTVLAPVDGRTEVWACGVTYEISRQARREEASGRPTSTSGSDAQRPEIFFKSAAWRVAATASR
jgi:2-dehydro-3-deoxy-D-arabinonate dehydratase